MVLLKIFFKIGENSYISYRSILLAPHKSVSAKIEIGNNVGIEHDCDIDFSGGLVIKDNVWISEKVLISTHDHTIINSELKSEQNIRYSGLVIEEDAWIGASVIILGSVKRIGKGAVIGAGSVIRKSVKDYQIVMGNPSQVVGKRFSF